jgi:hypothetical protein
MFEPSKHVGGGGKVCVKFYPTLEHFSYSLSLYL